MSKAVVTLVGIKRFKSKKGNEVCILSLSRPFTEEENARGSYGNEIRTEFAPQHQINDFKADCIGKAVNLNYAFNTYGRPELDSVEVLSK